MRAGSEANHYPYAYALSSTSLSSSVMFDRSSHPPQPTHAHAQARGVFGHGSTSNEPRSSTPFVTGNPHSLIENLVPFFSGVASLLSSTLRRKKSERSLQTSLGGGGGGTSDDKDSTRNFSRSSVSSIRPSSDSSSKDKDKEQARGRQGRELSLLPVANRIVQAEQQLLPTPILPSPSLFSISDKPSSESSSLPSWSSSPPSSPSTALRLSRLGQHHRESTPTRVSETESCTTHVSRLGSPKKAFTAKSGSAPPAVASFIFEDAYDCKCQNCLGPSIRISMRPKEERVVEEEEEEGEAEDLNHGDRHDDFSAKAASSVDTQHGSTTYRVKRHIRKQKSSLLLLRRRRSSGSLGLGPTQPSVPRTLGSPNCEAFNKPPLRTSHSVGSTPELGSFVVSNRRGFDIGFQWGFRGKREIPTPRRRAFANPTSTGCTSSIDVGVGRHRQFTGRQSPKVPASAASSITATQSVIDISPTSVGDGCKLYPELELGTNTKDDEESMITFGHPEQSYPDSFNPQSYSSSPSSPSSHPRPSSRLPPVHSHTRRGSLPTLYDSYTTQPALRHAQSQTFSSLTCVSSSSSSGDRSPESLNNYHTSTGSDSSHTYYDPSPDSNMDLSFIKFPEKGEPFISSSLSEFSYTSPSSTSSHLSAGASSESCSYETETSVCRDSVTRNNPMQGWSGEWNVDDMQVVIMKLRTL
ncbi:hypothetical protein K435DRAFT_434363 [Dendrothele bispora CBS 962.96]|uniref:Uncharacterized protein n=1 Tax=Dendrothele bispora (strain CBS 962.96) TaxID=1314807 RepID=A0A4S8MFA6_DENBC|nr:hypothetical protein K435DRAFT_434363 [Dendrothele bispora CBS 962.96]